MENQGEQDLNIMKSSKIKTTPSLQAGIARRVINPISGTALLGYPGERLGFEVADDLNATALVLKTPNCLACIISLDVGVIDEDELSQIRREIQQATGIAGESITVCATHTHSAPVTINIWGWGTKNQAYLDQIRPCIVEAAVEAQGALKPVRAGIGMGLTDVGINRREVELDGTVKLGYHEWGPRDRELTVMRFEAEDGPVANLVHLSAHPTSRGGEASVSRDWPGVMMDRVEKVTGVPVLFINGSFGDVAPRTNVGGVVGDGTPAAIEVGLRAATDALSVWQNIKEFRDIGLQTFTTALILPYAPLPSREEAEQQLRILGDTENALGENDTEWCHWNAVMIAHQGEIQTSRSWQQTLTRLGPLVIVPFGGEIFSEIALRLKKASPYAYTLCAGTSNGSHGYYVTREARARGGYEPWVAKAFNAYLLADNIDDVLVQENLRLLEAMSLHPGEDA